MSAVRTAPALPSRSAVTPGRRQAGLDDGPARAVFAGTAGDDRLEGTPEGDLMDGEAGDDSLYGNEGDDALFGQIGDDILLGGAGQDRLEGGDGIDILDGGAGADVLDGGEGDDAASYSFATSGVVVSMEAPTLNTGEAAGDRYADIENLVGSAHADTLIGDGEANAILGGGGDDDLRGGGGDDVLEGQGGADTLTGGAGYDFASYGRSTAGVTASIQAGGGSDGDRYISIEGLLGGAFDDDLTGDDGSSTIVGEGGNDRLDGGANTDLLIGGDGDDVIVGGLGNDLMIGGAGRDSFVFRSALESISSFEEAPDVIQDFETGVDTLDLSALTPTSISISETVEPGVSVLVIETTTGTMTLRVMGRVAMADIRTLTGLEVLGSSQDDTLEGGDESDVIAGMEGADVLTGGGGRDVFRYVSDSDSADDPTGRDWITDFESGVDRIDLSALDIRFVDIFRRSSGDSVLQLTTATDSFSIDVSGLVNPSDLMLSRPASFSLWGSNTGGALVGSAGNDSLSGGRRDDVLTGDDGDDRLSPGGGDDLVDGGAGLDVVVLDGSVSGYTVRRLEGGGYAFEHAGDIDVVRGVEMVVFGVGGLPAISLAEFEQQAFDPVAYLAVNPDVFAAVGFDLNAARSHYFTFGVAEGRTLGDFDAWSYLASNPGLIATLGLDPLVAGRHYLTTGRAAGLASDSFDELLYVASNPDLVLAIGADREAAMRHYVTHGLAEGRLTAQFDPLLYIASNPSLARDVGDDAQAGLVDFLSGGWAGYDGPTFDPLAYVASNPDLIEAFRTDGRAALAHYLTFGADEGRPTDVFRSDQYLAVNMDLLAAGLDRDEAQRHYILYGFDEGRATSGFDVVAYMLTYPDLAGLSAAELIDHWITYGFREGRSVDALFGDGGLDGRSSGLADWDYSAIQAAVTSRPDGAPDGEVGGGAWNERIGSLAVDNLLSALHLPDLGGVHAWPVHDLLI